MTTSGTGSGDVADSALKRYREGLRPLDTEEADMFEMRAILDAEDRLSAREEGQRQNDKGPLDLSSWLESRSGIGSSNVWELSGPTFLRLTKTR